MRTIKFRGKRRDNGKWIEGSLILNPEYEHPLIGEYYNETEDGHPISVWREYEVIPETVGQFTGHTDSTQKETYEGDIIGRTSIPDRVIYWDVNGFYTRKTQGIGTTPLRVDEFDVVIGNIHDNPELLQ